MISLVDRVIRIHNRPGKYVVTRHYRNHGQEYINYKPVNTPSNEPVVTQSLDDIDITVLKVNT